MKNEAAIRRISLLVLITGPLVSLMITPFANFDPINLVKNLVLSGFGFAIFALFIFSDLGLRKRLNSGLWIVSALFIVSMVSSMLFSGAPFTQQFWGIFGRNNGFLNYLILLFLTLGVGLIQDVNFYKNVSISLIVTATIATGYAIIQTLGLDPIKYSVQQTFATFGNVNFLSAFFGISSSCAVALIIDRRNSNLKRSFLAALVFIDLIITYKTGSIQGIMIFVAATGVTVFLWIRSQSKLRVLRVPYILLGILGIGLTIFGLENKGPLAKFVFQPSVTYREDYWHAGWVMTLKHPFFGVGLDSYGDWYRQYRGLISTIRTTPERTANTAHNIFLDISSSGGFPLILTYLALLAFAIRASFKVLRKNREFNGTFVAIFSAWIAFQVQALISIAQVGVTVWGWILTGAIIGFEKVSTQTLATNGSKKINRRGSKKAELSPVSALAALIGFGVGIAIAFPPFNADMKFKAAYLKGDLVAMTESVNLLGSSAYLNGVVLEYALKNSALAQADPLTASLNERFPRDWFGWKVLYLKQSSTEADKKLALAKLQELDPFNPELPKS